MSDVSNLKDYSEDSIPVLNKDKEIIGAITSSDIIEAVDEEMSMIIKACRFDRGE
ncbi:MAG: hypothetical protein ACLS9K_15410 [Lachnospira eligens]